MRRIIIPLTALVVVASFVGTVTANDDGSTTTTTPTETTAVDTATTVATTVPPTTVPFPTTTTLAPSGPPTTLPPVVVEPPLPDSCLDSDGDGHGTRRWSFAECFTTPEAELWVRVVRNISATYGVSIADANVLLIRLLLATQQV